MADLDDSYGATLALNDNPPPLDPISAPATDDGPSLPEGGTVPGASYRYDPATHSIVAVPDIASMLRPAKIASDGKQGSAPAPYGVGNYLDNVATTVGDIPGMVMRGGATGIAELLYSSGILDKSQVTKAREFLKTLSEKAKDEGVNPVVNAIGEGVGQFLPAFLPVFYGLRALQVINLGRIGASLIAEAVSGAFSFNPDEPNIAKMALEHVDQKELLGVVTKLMATDPADGDAMNRIRNGIQDMAIVGAFDGLVHAVPKAWAAARGRVAEGKSPIQMGGSIENVGPGGKVPGDPVDLLFRTYYGGANLTPSASKKIKKIMSEAGGKTWKEMEAALLSNDGLKNRIRDVVSGVKETRSKGRWPAKIDLTTVDGVFSALRQKLGATFDGKGSNSKYMHTADGTAYRVSDHKSATRRSDQSDLFIEVYPEDDGMKIVAGDNEVMLPWGSKELTSRDGLQKIIDAIQPTGGKVPGERRGIQFPREKTDTNLRARNLRRISMEVDPGEGSPWAAKYGKAYGALEESDKYLINESVTAKAIEIASRREGITLTGNVHGTGGWELYQNPTTVQQTFASKEAATRTAARLGLMLNQTEVWVNSAKPLTKNPTHYGIDIIEGGTSNLRDSNKLRELFTRITEADPSGMVRGYQPVEFDNGAIGIRIIIDKDTMKGFSKANKTNLNVAGDTVKNFFDKTMNDIVSKLDYDVRLDLQEIELTKLRNDWKEHPNGQGFKSYLHNKAGTDANAEGGTAFDLDGQELEKYFSGLLRGLLRGSKGAAKGTAKGSTKGAAKGKIAKPRASKGGG